MESDIEPLFKVSSEGVSEPPIMMRVEVQETIVDFEFDTGSSVTTMPHWLYYKEFSHLKLENTIRKYLFHYGGQRITYLGRAKVNVQFKNIKFVSFIHVVETPNPPLLGRDWMRELQIEIILIYILK